MSPLKREEGLAPSFGLMLFLIKQKFSAISRRGSYFFILPNDLFSNADL